MKTLILVISYLSFLSLVQAQTTERYSSFDEIVRELNSEDLSPQSRTQAPQSGIENVRIHAGVGIINSRLQLKTPSNLPKMKTLRGVEAFVGIDLFSSEWIAEGAMKSFNPEDYSSSRINFKEFDLRLIYLTRVFPSMYFRGGLGLSARYIDLDSPIEGIEGRQFATPATLALVGFSASVTPNIYFGADVAIRAVLTGETIDDGSVDGAVRLVGSF